MKSKEEIKNMVAKRRYGKKWEDILSKEQLFDEVLEEYAHQSGPSESSSEGVSKIREVMNWISQCVDEDHNLEVSEIKMIWNDLSDAISLIESSHVVSSGEGMAEALSLLKEYEQWEADLISDNEMWWPSVPKDRISGKTYDKMLELQEKRNKLLASLSPASNQTEK